MKERILQIGKDSTWYLSANIATGIIGFIALPILTRLFIPRDYGIFSLVNTAISLFAPITFAWLVNAVIRYYPTYEKQGELDVFYTTATRSFPYYLGALLLVGLPIVLFVLPLGEYRLLVTLGLLVFAFYFEYSVLHAMMRARRMAWQYASLVVLICFCRYIVGAGITYYLDAGVNGPFWGWLIGFAIAIPVEVLALGLHRSVRPGKHSRELHWEFLRYGFPLIFVTFLSEVLSASDRYMLQAMKGATQVGLYSMVYTLVSNLEGVIAVFLMTGSAPIIMRVFEHEGEERVKLLISKLTRYFLLLITPVLLGVWILRDPLTRVIASSKYVPAESVYLPVAIGMFLFYLAWLPSQAFFLRKETKLTLVPMAVATVCNLALNLLMIPAYGYDGAAWATAISYGLYFVIATAIARRRMPWLFPTVAALKTAAACGVMAGALYGMMQLHLHGLASLLAYVAVGSVVYLLTFLLIGGFTKAELGFALSILARVPVVGRIVPARKKEVDED